MGGNAPPIIGAVCLHVEEILGGEADQIHGLETRVRQRTRTQRRSLTTRVVR